MPTNLKHDQERRERKERDMVLTKKTEGRKEGRGRRLRIKREGKEEEEKETQRLWETRAVVQLVFKLMCNFFLSPH